MRRMVIDCDRCEKKDVSPFYSLYTEAGEGPQFMQPPEARRRMMEQVSYDYDQFGETLFAFLEFLEGRKGWQHYCDKCFQKVCDGLAATMMQTRISRKAGRTADATELAAVKPTRTKKAS